MRKIQLTKFILFIIVGIYIVIFQQKMLDYLCYVVGATMIVLSMEEIIVTLVEKKNNNFFDAIISLILGILTLFLKDSFVTICVIWGSWSLYRASETMAEAWKERGKGVSILRWIEAGFSIACSVLLILDPESHVAFHIVLLGLELVIEALEGLTEFYGLRPKLEQIEEEVIEKIEHDVKVIEERVKK